MDKYVSLSLSDVAGRATEVGRPSPSIWLDASIHLDQLFFVYFLVNKPTSIVRHVTHGKDRGAGRVLPNGVLSRRTVRERSYLAERKDKILPRYAIPICLHSSCMYRYSMITSLNNKRHDSTRTMDLRREAVLRYPAFWRYSYCYIPGTDKERRNAEEEAPYLLIYNLLTYPHPCSS